jgi:hypothetical protein
VMDLFVIHSLLPFSTHLDDRRHRLAHGGQTGLPGLRGNCQNFGGSSVSLASRPVAASTNNDD